MNLSAIFAFLLVSESYLLSAEAQQALLAEHAVFPAEGRQHQQLALSLRNQRLLEQQAESRARQLQHQLQAAEALHAMRQLSVMVAPPELHADPKQQQSTTLGVQVDLYRFRLLALFLREGRWIARLGYGDHIVSARSGDIILGDVAVIVRSDRVILSSHDSRHTLALGIQ